jgi:glycosyltransferase involved in cell wall biosynthesis
MTLRVLQVVTDTDRRGAQVFATDLEGALTEQGVAVRTVALAPGSAGGLDVPVLGNTRLSAAGLRALRVAARECDVVVGHGSTTLPACALALFGSGVPFVYRQISDSSFWASTPARRARVRVGLSRAARVVALWDGAAAVLTESFGVRADRITVVPNGVPPDRFVPVDDAGRGVARERFGVDAAARVIAYLGALVPEKGVDLAIEAVGQVPDALLLVVGAGPERDALEQLAMVRAPRRVVFAGSVDDARDAYAAADVVVLPSRGGDSMPAVLIEAGLMGVPCVSTPVAGIPEIVRDGITGLLLSTTTAAALGTACASILDDAARGRALGRAAREHCLDEFGIDRVAERWRSVLESVAR